MSVRAWIQASRPLAQANIALPLVFGQGLAIDAGAKFSWSVLALVHLFGVFDQLFIVYSNDVADMEADRSNTTYNAYSGGSRVLVEGKLTRRQLAMGAVVAALSMAGVAMVFALSLERPVMPLLWAFALFLMWAYSFRPLRLSYRGQGEILQAVGIGLGLPVFGFYAHSGSMAEVPWLALMPAVLLGYAGNLTTALPDYPSDLAERKRTFAVLYGERPARLASLVTIAAAILAAPLVLPDAAPSLMGAAVVAPLLLLGLNLWRFHSRAGAENGEACRWFVTLNGGAITLGFLLWTAALVV